MLLSVIVNFAFGATVSPDALPVFVQASRRLITLRSGALCVSVMMQPFIAILPVPVKPVGVVPPDCGDWSGGFGGVKGFMKE